MLKGEIVQKHKIAQCLREFNCIKHPKWGQISWYKVSILRNSIPFISNPSLRKTKNHTSPKISLINSYYIITFKQNGSEC